jgi:hypothetical protein
MGVDLTGATVTVAAEPAIDLVTVNPAVAGLPTAGMATSVAIGPKDVVEYAGGPLVKPVKLGDYPLIGTAAGFKRLQDQGPGRGITPQLGVPQPNEPPVVAVTGAHLALLRVFGGDGPGYLEPAYVFETAASGVAPTVLALPDRLLKPIPPGDSKPVPMPQPAPAPSPGVRMMPPAGTGSSTSA